MSNNTTDINDKSVSMRILDGLHKNIANSAEEVAVLMELDYKITGLKQDNAAASSRKHNSDSPPVPSPPVPPAQVISPPYATILSEIETLVCTQDALIGRAATLRYRIAESLRSLF